MVEIVFLGSMLVLGFLSSSVVYLVGALLASSLIYVFMLSFSALWYSYLLFLVYVGGVLVLLVYMCFVSSNTRLSWSVFNPLPVLCTLVYIFGGMSVLKFEIGVSGFLCGSTVLGSDSVILLLVVLLLCFFIGVCQIAV